MESGISEIIAFPVILVLLVAIPMIWSCYWRILLWGKGCRRGR